MAAASEIDGEKVRKTLKCLISGFKSVDSAFDEWVRNQGQEFSASWLRSNPVASVAGRVTGSAALTSYGIEILMFHKASEITRTIFRGGLGGKFDKKLTAVLGTLLYSRLGKATQKFSSNELLLQLEKNPPPKVADGYKGRSAERNVELAKDKIERKSARLAGQVEGSFEAVLDDARAKVADKVKPALKELVDNKNPPINNYHQVRIGVLLGCLEMIGLGEKLYHDGVDPREWDAKSWF